MADSDELKRLKDSQYQKLRRITGIIDNLDEHAKKLDANFPEVGSASRPILNENIQSFLDEFKKLTETIELYNKVFQSEVRQFEDAQKHDKPTTTAVQDSDVGKIIAHIDTWLNNNTSSASAERQATLDHITTLIIPLAKQADLTSKLDSMQEAIETLKSGLGGQPLPRSIAAAASSTSGVVAPPHSYPNVAATQSPSVAVPNHPTSTQAPTQPPANQDVTSATETFSLSGGAKRVLESPAAGQPPPKKSDVRLGQPDTYIFQAGSSQADLSLPIRNIDTLEGSSEAGTDRSVSDVDALEHTPDNAPSEAEISQATAKALTDWAKLKEYAEVQRAGIVGDLKSSAKEIASYRRIRAETRSTIKLAKVCQGHLASDEVVDHLKIDRTQDTAAARSVFVAKTDSYLKSFNDILENVDKHVNMWEVAKIIQCNETSKQLQTLYSNRASYNRDSDLTTLQEVYHRFKDVLAAYFSHSDDVRATDMYGASKGSAITAVFKENDEVKLRAEESRLKDLVESPSSPPSLGSLSDPITPDQPQVFKPTGIPRPQSSVASIRSLAASQVSMIAGTPSRPPTAQGIRPPTAQGAHPPMSVAQTSNPFAFGHAPLPAPAPGPFVSALFPPTTPAPRPKTLRPAASASTLGPAASTPYLRPSSSTSTLQSKKSTRNLGPTANAASVGLIVEIGKKPRTTDQQRCIGDNALMRNWRGTLTLAKIESMINIAQIPEEKRVAWRGCYLSLIGPINASGGVKHFCEPEVIAWELDRHAYPQDEYRYNACFGSKPPRVQHKADTPFIEDCYAHGDDARHRKNEKKSVKDWPCCYLEMAAGVQNPRVRALRNSKWEATFLDTADFKPDQQVDSNGYRWVVKMRKKKASMPESQSPESAITLQQEQD